VSLSPLEIQFEYTTMNDKGTPGSKQTLDIDIAGNVVR
jgi:hypothetical protein